MNHFSTLIFALLLSIGAALPAKPQSAVPVSNASNSATSAIWSQVRAVEQQEKNDLQGLNQQMADLKAAHQRDTAPPQQQLASLNDAFQNAMKQLQAQYDATRNRDDEERAELTDRIKPGYLSLYNTKKASVASVYGREDEAIQNLRKQEDLELQSIREKYDAQRKAVQQEAAAQRQAITNQFDAEIKGLK